MPEGPEVRHAADCLHHELHGALLINLLVTEKSRYHTAGEIPGMQYLQMGAEVGAVCARGKRIVFIMHNPDGGVTYLVSFLGLEGHWLFEPAGNSGIIMEFHRIVGEIIEPIQLYYDDSRHQGFLKAIMTMEEYTHIFKDIGPDLLSEEVTLEEYHACLRRPRLGKKLIADFMLEQQYFSGIGNYLRADILYRAKISPFRPLASLSDADIATLFQESIACIQEAYIKRGFTLRSYINPAGVKGTYMPCCYGRDTTDAGEEIIKAKMKQDRTIHYVPTVQV